MATSNTIDLSQLPAPLVVEQLDYERLLEARKARIIALFAADEQTAVAGALALESEPMTILVQENTERELILRQRVNDAARAVLLAFAKGSDLEHIAAEYGVSRLTIKSADPNTMPPTPAVMEEDEDLRDRAQLAWEGLSTAGPRGAYEFHARSAHGLVADASAISPEPCDIVVSVLSREGDGTASEEVLSAVRAALSDEDVRPLGDRVTVQSSQIIQYNVVARLYLKGNGPGQEVTQQTAISACAAYVQRPRRQGVSIWRSALTAALHVEGVDHLELLEPATDILLDSTQAGTCMSLNVTIAEQGNG
ncbi:baseplate assembly protein [Bordetella sp. 2513F-2]